ncbi:MAG: hypothetical protein ACOVKC_02605, partial [Brevundimonas sp.]
QAGRARQTLETRPPRAFANELDAFITSQRPVMRPEAQAQMAQMGSALRAQITGSPATIKAGLIQQAAAAAPASQ